MDKIESVEFRREARANCYRYGTLCIYSDHFIGLDSHTFPNYRAKEGIGAVEKFLTLIQSLGKVAAGSDAIQKLAKPLPGVEWGGDDLSLSLNIDGTMYFTDYPDYTVAKSNIRRELLSQGWTQNNKSSKVMGLAVTTYIPKRSSYNALYNDDPVDAAGMAMMVSAAQNVSMKMDILSANIKDDKENYAIAQARLDVKTAIGQKTSPTLSKLGNFGSDIGFGIDAMGANFNSAMVAKWSTAGHPLELLIEGETAARSVNGVLTDLKLTEKSFVVDSTSNGMVYPTAMDVSLSIKNLYGSLLTTSSR